MFDIQRFAATWSEPAVSALKVDVALNANGNIAQTGQTVKGTKTVTINGFKTAGTAADAKTVWDAIIGDIGGGSFDTLTGSLTTVKRMVDE